MIKMDNLFIEASHFNPAIYFNTQENVFEISGDSYDKEFYKPVLKWLSQYLRQNRRPLQCNFYLGQLHSGGLKGLNEVLCLLEDYNASTQIPININWVSSSDNDDTLDYGNDAKECFDHLAIQVSIA